MKKLHILTIFLTCFYFTLLSQVPQNLVTNGDFEFPTNDGSRCRTTFGLSNWRQVGTSFGTPDWVAHANDYSVINCVAIECLNNPLGGNQYIFIGKDAATPGGETIFNDLTNSLEIGKKYKMRVWATGRPGDYFAVHLLKNFNNWNTGLPNTILGTIPNFSYDPNNHCSAFVYEKIFEVTESGINKIAVTTVNGLDGNCNIWFDNVELYEYCTELIIRQARFYKHESELEEANYIISGSVINGIAGGDVSMLDGSVTTYKANTEVSLVEGFNVERGADFTAKIAPCGKSCLSSDLNVPTDYYVCDNGCIVLQGSPYARGMTIVWSSPVENHLDYLSTLNSLTPVFCPPSGASGLYTYSLTITNPCGETTTKTIRIHYDELSNPNPDFTILNSNLSVNPDHPELAISVPLHTERLLVEVLDCAGNILKTSEFKSGADFLSPATVLWSLADYFTPCGCYKIRIKSKNVCYPEWKEVTLDWNRITAPSNIVVPTASPCINGKRWICFNASGVNQIQILLFNRDGATIMDKTVPYTGNNPYCYQIPDDIDILGSSTYFMIATFFGCDGTQISQETTIYFGPCGDGILEPDSGLTWDGDTYSSGIYYSNPDNGLIDSLYSSISPNPVTDVSLINYHIPEAGTVKISILNSNFEEAQVLVQENNTPSGNYQVEFANNNLNNGVNYYMIELYNSQTARQIRRFTVIK